MYRVRDHYEGEHGYGNAAEITSAGKQLATRTLIRNGAGDLFGILLTQHGDGLLVAIDGTNALDEAPMIANRLA